MELSDDVIRLRRLEPSDAPAIAAACADPELGRFIPGIPVPYTVDDAEAYLRIAAREWKAGTRRAFAVAKTSAPELCGTVDVDLREVGTIGYWIAPEYRGRGLATRALLLLSRWAVTDGKVERLELTTHPENVASQRVAEKAGFVREGVLRAYLRVSEGRRDSVLFSLLPSDLD